MTPLFSVIVCAYNEEKLIRDCLKSIKEQNFSSDSYEVLIIDDESNDGTSELVIEFLGSLLSGDADFRYYRIKHGGLSVARNTGVALSKGRILVFIDGDALAEGNWLKEYALTFANDECGFSSGRINLLNHKDPFSKVLQNTRFRQSFSKPYNNHFHGVNMAFRKEVFEKHLGFYENFEQRGDDTSFRNIVSRDFNYCPSPNAVVLHERPASYKAWYKVYKKELKLQFLVYKAISVNGTGKRYLIPLAKAIVIVLLLFLGVVFLNGYLIVVAFSVFFFSKRNLILKKYQNSMEWSYVLTSTALDTLLKPFYFLLSFLRYQKEELRPAHSTPRRILLSSSNRS